MTTTNTTNNAVRVPCTERIEMYSGGNLLEFESLEDARFYYHYRLTRDERKSVARENKYNSNFAAISAEEDLEEIASKSVHEILGA